MLLADAAPRVRELRLVDGMDHYWREVSLGAVDLTGGIVVGWYDLAQPHAYYNTGASTDLEHLRADCVAAATANGVDVSPFYGTGIVVNGSLSASFGRIGVTWIPDTGDGDFGNRARVTQHEMGHGWGLPHSTCADDGYYSSRWDVMSLGFSLERVERGGRGDLEDAVHVVGRTDRNRCGIGNQ
jgi:hypothetical protein